MTDFSGYIGMEYHHVHNNCWGFFRRVQAEMFQRDLPEFPVDPNDLRTVIKTFTHAPERKRWQRIYKPLSGDAVLLRRAKSPIHIGVWLDIDGGGILHCFEGFGVVFQTQTALSAHGWHISGLYRFQPHG